LFRVKAVPQLPVWLGSYLVREKLCLPGERILVAVSGGPDSTALLHLLARLAPDLGLSLGVAHFNHGLRGAASREDARFVARLAGELGFPFYVGQGEVAAWSRTRHISRQMAARELRRTYLQETRRSHGYQKIALGHTAEDQVELFFLRLLRGSGLAGLKGMWPVSPDGLVRPLLAVGKEPILAWLHHEGLPYREDASNQSRRYLRNRVRLDLIPQLAETYNPRLREAVWRLMALLQEDERLLQEETARWWPKAVAGSSPELVRLSLPTLLDLPPGLRGRLLQAATGRVGGDQSLTTSHLESLLALAQSRQSGGQLSLPGCIAARAGAELHLMPPLPPPPSRSHLVRLEAPGTAETASGWCWEAARLSWPAASWSRSPEVAWLDAAHVDFPLEFRAPQPGDRFWPAGAPGTRKLQDFLVDRKIPRWLRPYLPLAVSRGQVLWVAGVGTAQTVQIGADTREAIMLRLLPAAPEARRVWEYLLALVPQGSLKATSGKTGW
jgi:tRNA(Ile)-lysidine synthase